MDPPICRNRAMMCIWTFGKAFQVGIVGFGTIGRGVGQRAAASSGLNSHLGSPRLPKAVPEAQTYRYFKYLIHGYSDPVGQSIHGCCIGNPSYGLGYIRVTMMVPSSI